MEPQKVNTKKHKNENNLSQDEMEANSLIIKNCLGRLIEAYDLMVDYQTGLKNETSQNIRRVLMVNISDCANTLTSAIDMGLMAIDKATAPVNKRGLIGNGKADFAHIGGIEVQDEDGVYVIGEM